jgi:starch phosphorylase
MAHTQVFKRRKQHHKGMDAESIRESFERHLLYTLSKDRYSATLRDVYHALALAARDRMVERWIATQHAYYKQDAKRVYYLSAEYLMGRMLENSLINLGIYDEAKEALKAVDLELSELAEQEADRASATAAWDGSRPASSTRWPPSGSRLRLRDPLRVRHLPAGDRDGWQVELPDAWLTRRQPLGDPAARATGPVRFRGAQSRPAATTATGD